MLYSSACEYAIRALTHLALEESELASVRMRSVKEIAERERIPQPFLGKIFQTLVRAGLVFSSKGPYGGFALARPSTTITLYEIRSIVDGTGDLERCAIGLPTCSDDSPCPHHPEWKGLRRQIKEYLQKTTLHDIAEAVRAREVALKH
jgi:Rrf2 family protein